MSDQDLETVASVIARLGPPPPDISAAWIEDARSQCGAGEIPPLDAKATFWQHMIVDEGGRAVWRSENSQSTASPSPPPAVEIDPRQNGLDRDRPRREAARKWGRPKWLIAAGIVAVVAVVAVFSVSDTSPPEEDSVQPLANAEPIIKPPRRSDPFSPEPIDNPEALTEVVSRQPDASPTPVVETVAELFESHESVSTSAATVASDRSDLGAMPANFTLDALIPASNADPETVPSADAKQPEVAAIDITENRADDDSLRDAIAQPTAATVPTNSQTTAVTLPSPPASGDSELPPSFVVLTAASPPSSLRLEFPAEIELELNVQENGWIVTAGDAALPIATLEPNPGVDEGSELQFRWLASAADTSLSQSLVHGRIITDKGDVVYLRAQLDAEAIAIDLSERDEKLKWMLGGPVLSSVTRLQTTLSVPEDVSVEWIEPLEKTSPQRTRGIAILTLKANPDAGSLAARIDVRTAATLTVRIRFGARLGPGMPWQWTDAKSIRTSLDAATTQLQVADNQLLQLEAAISRAKKIRARQQEVALEIQRDRIEEAVRSGTLIAKRLAELDQLVALLGAEGTLTMHLQVRWPTDAAQTLLSIDEPSQ